LDIDLSQPNKMGACKIENPLLSLNEFQKELPKHPTATCDLFSWRASVKQSGST